MTSENLQAMFDNLGEEEVRASIAAAWPEPIAREARVWLTARAAARAQAEVERQAIDRQIAIKAKNAAIWAAIAAVAAVVVGIASWLWPRH